MKQQFLLTLASASACLLSSTSRAQAADDDATPSLNSLLTPDSPAFVILGVSPTTIQRPTTPKAVATSLLSAFSSHGRTLVPNYALEVAPYWLASHPQLSWDALAKNSFSNPLQTLTISVATSGPGSPSDETTNATGAPSSSSSAAPRAALGLRSTLVKGEPDQQLVAKCQEQLEKQTQAVGPALAGKIRGYQAIRKSELSDLWVTAFDAGHQAGAPGTTVPAATAMPKTIILPLPPASEKDLQTSQQAFKAQWAEVHRMGWAAGFAASGSANALPSTPAPPAAPELPKDNLDEWTTAAVAAAPSVDSKGCLKAATSHMGFVLDAAAAVALSFPSGAANEGRLSTYSAWLTGSYLTTNFSALGLVRFVRDKLDVADQRTTGLDVGLRPIVALSRFGISAEGVYRVPLDSETSKSQYRVDLTTDVELVDGQWFSVTGGHDFVDGSDWSKFFAIANFKGTFGAGPTVTPKGP
jgi:hypothetical protein